MFARLSRCPKRCEKVRNSTNIHKKDLKKAAFYDKIFVTGEFNAILSKNTNFKKIRGADL
jgi:hypothetical protein